MRRALLATIAVVAALTASTLFLPALAGATPVAATGSDRPAASEVSILSTNSFGGTQTLFYTGLSNGQVYFYVTDTAGDSSATIAINDLNASRDGLTNPVGTMTVNFGTGTTNASYDWGHYFQIPVALHLGGRWNLTVSGSKGGFAYTNFTVQTFRAGISVLQADVLPAGNVSVLFDAYSPANEALFSGVTSFVLTGEYYTTGGTYVKLPGTPVPTTAPNGIGWYNFTAPTNGAGAFYLTVWANLTSNGGNTSAVSDTSGYIGSLGTPSVALASCADLGTPASSFVAGTPVCVQIVEEIAGTSTPASGLNAAIKFVNGATFVTPPGNPPSSLVTDSQGLASLSFLASGSVFSFHHDNTVSVTISDPADPSLSTVTTNATFTIYNTTTYPSIDVTWSASQYYSGATASLSWTLGGGNSSVTKGWSVSYWVIEAENGAFLRVGTPSANTTQGSTSLVLPSSFYGTVEAIVVASNATDATEGGSLSYVAAGAIELTPSEGNYSAGQTVTIGVSTVGTLLSGASLWGTVVDDNGNWVFNGPVTGGSISISVPSGAPPASYTVSVIAETATAGAIANASITLKQSDGVALLLGIGTSSNYVDGSFQAGQTVTVDYRFTTTGDATLPQTYTLVLTPTETAGTGAGVEHIVLNSASGSFSYTIPSGTPNGLLYVSAAATLGGTGCTGVCHVSSYFTAQVNNNPSSLSYNLGNSGFTTGDLVVIVVLIVLGLLAFFVLRGRGRPMMMRPESPTSSSSPSSSTSTGSSGSGSGGSSPPGGSP